MQIYYSARQSGKYLGLVLARNLVACLVLVGFWWLIRDLMKYYGNKLTLHEDGILFQQGIITTNSKEVPYPNINIVSVKQGILGKLLNYGDLVISTGGDQVDIHFEFLDDPHKFKGFINDKIEN